MEFVFCPICGKNIILNEIVILDSINTLYHEYCYDYLFEEKDKAKLIELINKYYFLQELNPLN